MPRPARLTVLTLLAATGAHAATPASQPSIDRQAAALVVQLGDPEPAVRDAAFDALSAMGRRAAPALRAAARGDRPAVADAAASLLLRMGWLSAADAPAVRMVLKDYGQRLPAQRIEKLKNILSAKLPNSLRVVIRVAAEDPAEEVAWAVLQDMTVDADVEAAVAAIDPAGRPSAMTVVLARAMADRGDPAAVPLLRGVLEHERRRPGASSEAITWTNQVLVEAETRQGRPAEAAAGVRELLDATPDGVDAGALSDRLLDLHARHGPLPGVAADLARADHAAPGHASVALALMAARNGLPATAGVLIDAALRERPGESEFDRAARLGDTANWLKDTGQSDAACRVFDRIAATETPSLRGRVVDAYLRLSDLHARAGHAALAGDALQRAMARQEGPLSVTINGESQTWPLEDEQAKVYWYYLMDAAARGDDAAVKTMTRNIVASGSTDGSQYLDVLPYLAAAATPDEIDAYFARAVDAAKARADAAPEKPVLWNDLAWLCARAGRRLPDAVAWAERAVRERPDESAYLDTLAEAKFRVGDVRAAIDLETKALSHPNPDEAFMQKQLARFRAAATTQAN